MDWMKDPKQSAKVLRQAIGSLWFTRAAQRRLRRPGRWGGHNLSGELAVSLTSFPPRFDSLHLTLACLLDQSIRPDRVILWIAHQDMERLPVAVTSLEDRGLEIRECDDLRSYKKDRK